MRSESLKIQSDASLMWPGAIAHVLYIYKYCSCLLRRRRSNARILQLSAFMCVFIQCPAQPLALGYKYQIASANIQNKLWWWRCMALYWRLHKVAYISHDIYSQSVTHITGI